MLPILFPVIPFHILWDLQYVQSSYAACSLSSHSGWYIVRFTVRSVKLRFPFSFQSFRLIYCEIYSTFSQATRSILFSFIPFDILWDLQYVQSSYATCSLSTHSVWYIVRFTVRSVKLCYPFSSLQTVQFDVFSDLRYLQSSHASHHPVTPWLCRTADQCNGGILPVITGTLHSGHAATLCLLSSRDDSMGPRNLWGY